MKRIALITILIIIFSLCPSIYPVDRAIQAQGTASLSLNPVAGSFNVGQTFTVDIVLDTGPHQIDGVSIRYLNYNPLLLEVQDADPNTDGIQIAVGTPWPNVQTLSNSVDAIKGTIKFSQVVPPPPAAPFNGIATLGTITFKVLSTGTASVYFDFEPSNVSQEGVDVLGFVNNGSYTLGALAKGSLSLSPASGSHEVGQQFAVNILINTGDYESDGVDVHFLRYDPKLLKADVVTPGTLFGDTATNIINNTAGTIDFSQKTVGGTWFKGSGTLATVTFKALAAGTSLVIFDFDPNNPTKTTDCNISRYIEGPDEDILGLVTNGAYTLADTTSPANVSNFQATAGDTQISLSWTNPSDADFAGVLIRRKTGGYPVDKNDGTQVYNSTGTSHTDTGLTNGTTYYYKAFSYDGVPNYSSGAQASAMPQRVIQLPGAPENLSAVAGDSNITLSWTQPLAGDAPTGYKVYYGTSPGVYNSPVDVGKKFTYKLQNLTNGTTYYLTVSAYNTAGEGPKASEISAKPDDTTAPAAVTDLEAENPTLNSIELSWTAPGDDGNTGTASTYDIRYMTSSITEAKWGNATPVANEPVPLVAGSKQKMTIIGLSQNQNYFFAMKTLDERGNQSALSNVEQQKTLREKEVKIKIEPEGKKILADIPVHTIIFKKDLPDKVLEDDDTTDEKGICRTPKDLTDFEEEKWDIEVSVPYYLTKKNRGQALSPAKETEVKILLLAGDLVIDNTINEIDWSYMGPKWHTADPIADINQDSDINSLDWHYLNKNWGQKGDE